jgi:hypothetical protein
MLFSGGGVGDVKEDGGMNAEEGVAWIEELGW